MTLKLYESTYYCTGKVKIAAAYAGVNLEIQNIEMKDTREDSYKSKFPLMTVPALEDTENGLTITDSVAIAMYISGKKANNTVCGKDAAEIARINQWIMFCESLVSPHTTNVATMLLGYRQYNGAVLNASQKELERALEKLNAFLERNTFLVGERVTLADIVMFDRLRHGFASFIDKNMQNKFSALTRWFRTIANQDEVMKARDGKLPEMVEEAVKFQPPKKEKEKKEKKEAPKPKAKKVEKENDDAEEEQEKPKPKAKNPLDALPPPKMVMDEWKRMYSNNDTRTVAMDWFWKNFDYEGYSIWHVAYAYPDELPSMAFMCSNLVGGFYQRLERAKKYAFGSLLVMKDAEGKNCIEGFFVVRGQEVPFEIYDAPDYDSYKFTKVEDITSKPEMKEYFEDIMAWDGKLQGKTYQDGKVFK